MAFSYMAKNGKVIGRYATAHRPRHASVRFVRAPSDSVVTAFPGARLRRRRVVFSGVRIGCRT